VGVDSASCIVAVAISTVRPLPETTVTPVWVANLMERAIHAGKSQADFACLFEILSDAASKPI